jgi:hypothetical protein
MVGNRVYDVERGLCCRTGGTLQNGGYVAERGVRCRTGVIPQNKGLWCISKVVAYIVFRSSHQMFISRVIMVYSLSRFKNTR